MSIVVANDQIIALEPPCLSSVYWETKTRHEIVVIWLWVRLLVTLIKYQIHRKTPSYIVWLSKGVGTEHVPRQAARIWEGGGMKNMSLLQMKLG